MTTILLDGDIYLHRAVSVATTSVTFGDESTLTMNQNQAESWLKGELTKLRQRLGANQIIMALGDRSANFRKDLCPTYKAKRAAIKPPGFLEFEARVVKSCKTVREPRLEGDDILGLLATKMKETVVVTIDKDLRQIPGMLYNPDKDEMQEIGEEGAAMFHLIQTLTGDSVDGYPGCPGIGPVKAAAILGPTETEHLWEAVVKAYAKAGKTEADALLQARLAFILRQNYYDRATKTVRLWAPGA